MTIYKVTIDPDDCIISTEVLDPGKHDFNEYGACVPIRVNGNDTVNVLLGDACGDLSVISMPDIDEGRCWTQTEINHYPIVNRVLKNGDVAISLVQSVDNHIGCIRAILRANENPTGRRLERC